MNTLGIVELVDIFISNEFEEEFDTFVCARDAFLDANTFNGAIEDTYNLLKKYNYFLSQVATDELIKEFKLTCFGRLIKEVQQDNFLFHNLVDFINEKIIPSFSNVYEFWDLCNSLSESRNGIEITYRDIFLDWVDWALEGKNYSLTDDDVIEWLR